jgi:hypothetical protein
MGFFQPKNGIHYAILECQHHFCQVLLGRLSANQLCGARLYRCLLKSHWPRMKSICLAAKPSRRGHRRFANCYASKRQTPTHQSSTSYDAPSTNNSGSAAVIRPTTGFKIPSSVVAIQRHHADDATYLESTVKAYSVSPAPAMIHCLPLSMYVIKPLDSFAPSSLCQST